MSMYMPQKSYNKPSLPPLSSMLKDQNYKLPSIDTFYDKNNQSSGSPMPTPVSSASTPIPMMAQPPQTQMAGPTPIAGQYPHGAFATQAGSLSVPTSRASSTSSSTGGSPTTPEFKKSKKQDKSFAFISHSVKTFPSQEPSIDNAPLARRKRRRTSPNELNILNQEFLLGSTPNKLRRVEIAGKVSMTEKAVQIWFQNKRQSLRKQGGLDREITELPPTPDVNVSMNSSFNSSMNNSMNNSAVNLNTSMSSINTSVVSSTPVKPVLNKAKSFTSPETNKFESPIKQRSSSTTSIFSKPTMTSRPSNGNIPTIASMNNVTSSTPDSSFVDDSDSSLILNESRKRVLPTTNSAMTFKLGKFKVHNDNKENLQTKVPEKANQIQKLLNNAAEETRKPLAEINSNKTAPGATKLRVNEGVENLLSLREGNWR